MKHQEKALTLLKQESFISLYKGILQPTEPRCGWGAIRRGREHRSGSHGTLQPSPKLLRFPGNTLKVPSKACPRGSASPPRVAIGLRRMERLASLQQLGGAWSAARPPGSDRARERAGLTAPATRSRSPRPPTGWGGLRCATAAPSTSACCGLLFPTHRACAGGSSLGSRRCPLALTHLQLPTARYPPGPAVHPDWPSRLTFTAVASLAALDRK